ncbi:MAG: ribbon-helix-helix protein, CopG family [Bryobacteraceae bacterium]
MTGIKSKRNVYAACHLTAETKDALKALAKQLKVSVSALMSEAIEDKIDRLEKETNGRHAAN